jgi:hypothetical protein
MKAFAHFYLELAMAETPLGQPTEGAG